MRQFLLYGKKQFAWLSPWSPTLGSHCTLRFHLRVPPWAHLRVPPSRPGSHFCRMPAILLKKRLWHRWFPVNFAKFFRTPLVAASVTYRNILINVMVKLFIRCKFKWGISVKYQLHLYLPRFQNFYFQNFLGTPYINW